MDQKTLNHQTAKFIASLCEALPTMSSDVMQGWIENPRGLKKLLSGLNPPAEPIHTYPIIVDYGLAPMQMVSAGRYDWVSDDITVKNFPLEMKRVEQLDALIVHFDCDLSSKEALTGLEKKDLRPATIEELLAFGAAFPEMQLKFPIIALGSSWECDGYRAIPCLNESDRRRSLNSVRWYNIWSDSYRFLAFRK